LTWKFKWRRKWSDVWEKNFIQNWVDLLENDPDASVYHYPELVRAWAETLGSALGVSPMFGEAEGDGAHALLPWVIVPQHGRIARRRMLTYSGQFFFGHHDPLVEGGYASKIPWPGFWNAVRDSTRTECDGALFHFVSEQFADSQFSEPCGDKTTALELVDMKDLEAVLARCSKSHRGDVHRQGRRLGERGEITLWMAGHAESSSALSDFRENFLRAYGSMWNQHPAGNFFQKPGVTDFVERVISEGVRDGWAHYSSLCVSGVPIAWLIGLFYRKALYYWIPTYDVRWQNFSPGKILVARLVEQAIARSWNRINFLTGAQPYKMAWNPRVLQMRSVRWYSPGVRGRSFRLYDRTKCFARFPSKETV
jgi:CelD/BcsL family acetyltransferase involved in cellulose biosynthesis